MRLKEPAFPTTPQFEGVARPGLTKREWFAGTFCAALVEPESVDLDDERKKRLADVNAGFALLQADALLEALDK